MNSDLPVRQLSFRAALAAKLDLIVRHHGNKCRVERRTGIPRRRILEWYGWLRDPESTFVSPARHWADLIDRHYAIAYEAVAVKRKRKAEQLPS